MRSTAAIRRLMFASSCLELFAIARWRLCAAGFRRRALWRLPGLPGPARSGRDAVVGSRSMPWSSRLRWSTRVLKAVLLESAVLVLGPTFPPVFDQGLLVPVPVLGAESVVLDDVAHGQQHMGVVVGAIAAFGRGVNGDIGDHAKGDVFGLEVVPQQLDVLFVGQFVREGKFEAAGELGLVAAVLWSSRCSTSFQRR